MISREHMRTLIPHAGAMFLLDEVFEWDEDGIVCTATTHRNPRHPLMRNEVLPAIVAVEYAAQAMALHYGLMVEAEGERPQPGWLVAIKELSLHGERLDEIGSPMLIKARRLLAFGGGLLYEFVIDASGTKFGSGRISAVTVPGI
jgi:predicted hotdog family 3-hydroxylacyl-ACP dehydratase